MYVMCIFRVLQMAAIRTRSRIRRKNWNANRYRI